jgi:hypothetical protein
LVIRLDRIQVNPDGSALPSIPVSRPTSITSLMRNKYDNVSYLPTQRLAAEVKGTVVPLLEYLASSSIMTGIQIANFNVFKNIIDCYFITEQDNPRLKQLYNVAVDGLNRCAVIPTFSPRRLLDEGKMKAPKVTVCFKEHYERTYYHQNELYEHLEWTRLNPHLAARDMTVPNPRLAGFYYNGSK